MAGNIFAVDGNKVVRFANNCKSCNKWSKRAADFYAVDTTNGWDTGTSTGGVGLI